MDNFSIYVSLTLLSLSTLFTFGVKLLQMFWYFIFVMVTLGCQLNGLWDQLRDKLLVGSLMNFSRKVNWGGRTSLSMDTTFHLQPRYKRSKGGQSSFPLTPFTLYWRVRQLCCCTCCCQPSVKSESSFFGLPTCTEEQQLSRNPPGFQGQVGTAETSSFIDCTATWFSACSLFSCCVTPKHR